MAAFLIYILKAAVVLAVLHSLYRLCLKRETLHSLNRAVLTGIMAAAVALPAVRITTASPSPMAVAVADAEAFIVSQADAGAQASPSAAGKAAAGGEGGMALWPRLVAVAYAGALALCLLRYALSLGSLWLMIGGSRRLRVAGVPQWVRVVECRGLTVACSWMHWVMLPPGLHGDKLRAVLAHELGHVRMGHSWDMLLCEMVTRLLWFLPSAWMLRDDLRDVHEYQADRRVLTAGIDADGYQRLLIETAAAPAAATAANSLCRSAVKRRLYMMCRHPSARTAALKAAYLLPIVAVAAVAFARPTMVSKARQTLERAEAEAPLLSPRALTEAAAKAVETAPDAPGPRQPELAEAPAARPEGMGAVAESIAAPAADSLRPAAMTVNIDPKPAAKAPADGKPEWSGLDVAPLTVMEYRIMPEKFWIERHADETHLVMLKLIESDRQFIRLDGKSRYIEDRKTGDRYMCRGIEGVGKKVVEAYITGHKGDVVRFTLIFPPLDDQVDAISIRKDGEKTVPVYRLKDVERKPTRIIR